MARGLLGGHSQHLLGMVAPDVGAGERDAPDTQIHGARAPWLARAEPVDRTVSQGVGDIRRWHHGQTNVPVRVDPASVQPMAQQIIMRGERIDHRQHRRRKAGGDPRRQRCRQRRRRQWALGREAGCGRLDLSP
jgi:hypothetical protein